MKIKLYILSTGIPGTNTDVGIDKYMFDFDNREDIEIIQEHNDNEVDEDNFIDSCVNYLHQVIGGELSQHFIPYIILDEIQYKQLKQII